MFQQISVSQSPAKYNAQSWQIEGRRFTKSPGFSFRAEAGAEYLRRVLAERTRWIKARITLVP